MQNTHAKVPSSVMATFGQLMTFGTPEELLLIATVEKRQGSVVRAFAFAATGQNLSMKHVTKDMLSVAFCPSSMDRRSIGACRGNIDCDLDYVNLDMKKLDA